jgi:outer membrane protein assembly factor BamB
MLAFAVAAAGQPVITGINAGELPRSGRVVIQGSGFGASGDVLIAGLWAWTTTWTDGRVVAYVPEAAPLGPTLLHVVVQGQQSNAVSLSVTARQSAGRVRWTFEADANNLWWRPALAPDGTVYVHTNSTSGGLVYALSPDGALLWVRKLTGYPYVPPTAGPDGAVYVGGIGTIYRISPGGTIDWQYRPPNGVNIEVSPTIGPDGLLYGAFEISGAFAIEPLTGSLVWSNSGEPMMSDKSGEAVEAKFGPSGPGEPIDQLYVSMDGGAGFYAFSLDGDQLFTASFGNIKGSAEVAIGSDGTIYGPRAIGLVVAAVDPSDGSTLWEYYPGASDWATGTNNVEIGPDDTLYFVGSSAKLEAFDPHSQSRQWQFFDPGYALNRPTVTPDGSTLVLAGSDTSIYGYPGFVKAFATRNGRELWSVDLPFQLNPGFRVYGVHHPRITPDGATAYVSTLSLAEYPLDQDPHTLLFAIDVTGDGGSDPPPPACNDDGICSSGEDCTNCPNDCPGQTSGNPSERWCCGDGVCSGPEDGLLCALDCGEGQDPPECSDALDNDGDGMIDFGGGPGGEPADPHCTDPSDDQERATRRCGLGFELTLLLAPLLWLRPRPRRGDGRRA